MLPDASSASHPRGLRRFLALAGVAYWAEIARISTLHSRPRAVGGVTSPNGCSIPWNASRTQPDPPRIRYDGSRIRHDGSRIRYDGSGIRHDGSRIRHDGSGIRHDGSRIRHDGSGIRHDGSRIRHDGRGIRHNGRGIKLPEPLHVRRELPIEHRLQAPARHITLHVAIDGVAHLHVVSRMLFAIVPAPPPTRKNQRTTSCPAPISAKVPYQRGSRLIFSAFECVSTISSFTSLQT
jgi:hypothetical protein